MKKAILLLLLVLFTSNYSFSQNRQLTFEDVMKFEDISDADISANGQWIVYGVWPDRGDGEVRVRSTSSSTFYTIERGDDPEITGNGAWVASFLKAPLKEQLEAEKDKPKQGMGLLSTSDGSMIRVDSVQWFTFSNDSRWIAYRHHQSKE
ncbi:MAG: S9 family peptidase, partial [Balneolaceae bacterium]|nr:S9 family peptidase [Balneolaceae bacterium]